MRDLIVHAVLSIVRIVPELSRTSGASYAWKKRHKRNGKGSLIDTTRVAYLP
jgi:hypothetical protein